MSYHSPTPHKIFISVAVVCLIGYAFFNSRFLLQGPEIVLANVNPSNNSIHTNTKDFSLKGTVKHSSFITVNNRPIMVDEAGNFNEKLLLSSGVSIIDIYARDKFGKETREKIDVVYAGDNSSSDVAYEQIALRAKEHSASTTSQTVEFTETVETDASFNDPIIEIPSIETNSTTTASSSVMTISPSSGI